MSTTEPRAGLARANGIDLYYEDVGPVTAPAVLLIMGLGAQHIYWPDVFVDALLAQGFRVVRFDNRDIGLSSKIHGVRHDPLPKAFVGAIRGRRVRAPYTLYDLVEDTAGLLDALGIQAAHLVGASMGGMIAQLFAALHRERTLSLTSIMSQTLHPSIPRPRLDVLLRLAMIGRRGRAGRDGYVRQSTAMFRAIHGTGYPFPAERVAERAARAFDRCFEPRGAERQAVAIVATGSFEALLSRVSAPTLVVHGGVDPLVRPAGGRASARAIRGARLEIVPRMGHFLHEPLMPELAGWIGETAAKAG